MPIFELTHDAITPVPQVSLASQGVRSLAQAVLNARGTFPNATLADLYDADAMPPELRKAHHKLDAAVDGLYKRGGFQSDRERVEHLFMLYETLAAPLMISAKKKKARLKVGAVGD